MTEKSNNNCVKPTSNKSFLFKKWVHLFNQFFDLDGNGIIEWNDFKQLIDVIGKVRGTKSDFYMTARLCLPDVWQKITEEIGKDDMDIVTLNDWIDLCEKTRQKMKTPEWLKAYIDYIFKLIDESGDKYVDQSEYVQVLGYFGISKTDSAHCFDKFAFNNQGKLIHAIDFKTFSNLANQFFRSEDPNSPGSWLFGTISV